LLIFTYIDYDTASLSAVKNFDDAPSTNGQQSAWAYLGIEAEEAVASSLSE